MKSFSIISEVDETGGVKLPDILLGLCDLESGDDLEIHLEGDNVVISKYPPTCIFCGSDKDLQEYKDRSLCCCCADELRNY